MSTKKYVRPESMIPSARVAHFLQFCHETRAGERISWREIVMVVDGLPRLPNKDNPRVIRARQGVNNVRTSLGREYELALDVTPEGARAINKFEDIMELSVIPVVREYEVKGKKIEKRMDLARRKIGEAENSERGRSMKAIFEKVNHVTKSAERQLVSIRGYLTSGDDD